MIIKEYRVVLPMTVDQYQVAQLFSVAEASKSETGGGEGVEILKNEPYKDGNEEGQYTEKIYHLESRVPTLVKMIAPKGSLQMDEVAWNAYPKCKTVLTNPYLGAKFEISIETLHLPDGGTTENAHGLPYSEWSKCEIVNIDIANDPLAPADYKEEFDPAKYESKKAGRGPLGKNWIKEYQERKKVDQSTPLMCCYKLVKCNVSIFGLQGKLENFIHRQENRLFNTFHRQVFCEMDKWYGMTMDDIRKLEDDTKADLERMIKEGEVKGTTLD